MHFSTKVPGLWLPGTRYKGRKGDHFITILEAETWGCPLQPHFQNDQRRPPPPANYPGSPLPMISEYFSAPLRWALVFLCEIREQSKENERNSLQNLAKCWCDFRNEIHVVWYGSCSGVSACYRSKVQTLAQTTLKSMTTAIMCNKTPL